MDRPDTPLVEALEAASGERLSRLLSLIALLESGGRIGSYDLSGVLASTSWARLRFLMHGPALPLAPDRRILSALREYRARLKTADRMSREANAKMRANTWLGPELFHRAEAAYEHAIEALDEAVELAPQAALYLRPYPAHGTYQSGMPRLMTHLRQTTVTWYSNAETPWHYEFILEWLHSSVKQELRRLESARRTALRHLYSSSPVDSDIHGLLSLNTE